MIASVIKRIKKLPTHINKKLGPLEVGLRRGLNCVQFNLNETHEYLVGCVGTQTKGNSFSFVVEVSPEYD